jgi:uncharacterized protein YdbL (DUF1318 family)
MNTNVWMKIFAGLCLICLGICPAQAAPDAEQAILERMESRLPELMQLKLAGNVGENNRALLEPRESLEREARRLVEEENRDRLALYRMMSERIGVPVDKVQSGRAKDIREKSPEGVWLQAPDGDWYRK